MNLVPKNSTNDDRHDHLQTPKTKDLTYAAESASWLHDAMSRGEMQLICSRFGRQLQLQAKDATITILSSAASSLFCWCGSSFIFSYILI